jgi:coenzyme F420-0:L-glutamate ligase / coenzyme F420-1:gamma-L-glutamate ligase
MGEGSESIPAVVIRGFKVTPTDRKLSKDDMTIDPGQDIYIRAFRSDRISRSS